MAEVNLDEPDRKLGSYLSGAEVERLREAANWLRLHRGLRFKELAQACEVAEHTVRNFAYRKSVRPDNAVLGRLYKHLMRHREMLPEGFFSPVVAPASEPAEGLIGRLARYDLIKFELPIAESDVKRIYDRYSGYYLCFRRHAAGDVVCVSWLHVLALRPNMKLSRWGLPLPRFTILVRHPDRLDPDTTHSYIIIGYGFSRNGRIYLCGQHDGELKNLILEEPAIAKFTYLQGLYLATAEDNHEPYAARVVCQRLGDQVSRDDWEAQIGEFASAEFSKRFRNAKAITSSLGKGTLRFDNRS